MCVRCWPSYLEQDITDEVQGQARKVLVARHFQIGGETLDTGIGNLAKVSLTDSNFEFAIDEPLLRSRKLSKYKSESGGSSLRSSLRSSAVVLIAWDSASRSEEA